MMKKKYNEKCYWKDCNEKLTHKWYPNKSKGHLLICQKHFDSLSEIYPIEVVGNEEKLIAVRVVLEND